MKICTYFLFLFIAVFLTACNHDQSQKSGQATTVGIETATVQSQQKTDYLEIPAHVMADPSRVVKIFPPLSGRIFALRVLPGQEVQKGQVIAMLQSGEIAQARADFEKAKIEVARADRALQRGKLLLQHEVLSQADYYELEATDQVSHSEVERTRQRIHELGFSEDGTSDEVAIRAPIAGVVLDIGTATGELQRSLDNATTIATIANLDSVWVAGDVFERDLATLQNAHSVEVLIPAYPGLTIPGRIANVSDAIDPNSHTLKLRIVLPNPEHKLKTDMFATVRIARTVRIVFIVPATAVLHEGDKTYVFVANASGKYDRRPVTVGATSESGSTKNVEILSGLNNGDKVVTVGGALLRPASGD